MQPPYEGQDPYGDVDLYNDEYYYDDDDDDEDDDDGDEDEDVLAPSNIQNVPRPGKMNKSMMLKLSIKTIYWYAEIFKVSCELPREAIVNRIFRHRDLVNIMHKRKRSLRVPVTEKTLAEKRNIYAPWKSKFSMQTDDRNFRPNKRHIMTAAEKEEARKKEAEDKKKKDVDDRKKRKAERRERKKEINENLTAWLDEPEDDMQVDDVDSAVPLPDALTPSSQSSVTIRYPSPSSGAPSENSMDWLNEDTSGWINTDAVHVSDPAAARCTPLPDAPTSSQSSAATKSSSPSSGGPSVTTSRASANVSSRRTQPKTSSTPKTIVATPSIPTSPIPPSNGALSPGIKAHIKVFHAFERRKRPTTTPSPRPRSDDTVPRIDFDTLMAALPLLRSDAPVQPHTLARAQQPIPSMAPPPGYNPTQPQVLAPSPAIQNYSGENKSSGSGFAYSPPHLSVGPYVEKMGGISGLLGYTPDPHMPSRPSSPRPMFSGLDKNGGYKPASSSYTAYTPVSPPCLSSPTALPNASWIQPTTPAYKPLSEARCPSSATTMIEPVMALPSSPASSAPRTPGSMPHQGATASSIPSASGASGSWDIPEAYRSDAPWRSREEMRAEEKIKDAEREKNYRGFGGSDGSDAWGEDNGDDCDDIGSSSDEDDSDDEDEDDEEEIETRERKRKYQGLGDESFEECSSSSSGSSSAAIAVGANKRPRVATADNVMASGSTTSRAPSARSRTASLRQTANEKDTRNNAPSPSAPSSSHGRHVGRD
ncbi:hypothetical protein EUX98_g8653 [Antrodiella citrinella]|uniref:Uncharacterized protein n=1 Tax=Antrodiella citrinella TaxID=2447956 RepID=A0A4S4M4J6_9APHY|nr:hypothetical protein EUX98_g8653 [Antrodiella citrinella]